MLRLTIIEEPEGETPETATIIVGPGGATIGRTRDNTWVLPDTQSLLSRSHFEIVFENGTYLLLDRSTNGTFINDAKAPVGRGNKAPVQDGDHIRLGDYRIEVALEVVGARPDPLFGDRPDFLGKDDPPLTPALDPLEPEPGRRDPESFGPAAMPDVFAAIQPKEMPADLFGGKSAAPGSTPISPEPLPRVEQPPGLVRDGYHERGPIHRQDDRASPTGPGAEQPPPRLFVPVAPAGAPESGTAYPPEGIGGDRQVADPAPATPVTDKNAGGAIPDDWYLEPAESAPRAEIPVQPGPVAPKPIVSRPVEPQPAAAALAPAPAAQPSPDSAQLEQGIRQAVSLALGQQAETMGRSELVRVVGEMAEIAQACSPGLMRAMSSRSQFKDHMRMDQTMIKAHDNNPLKFCASPEEALARMLLNDQPGLLRGKLAVAEAFRELAAHQSALIAALQPALQDTVEQFSPAAIEVAAKAEGGIGFPLASGKGKLWDTYEQVYARLADSERGRLEQFFMTSLAKHYERCLGSLGS